MLRRVIFIFARQYPGGFIRKNSIEDSLGRANQEIRSLTSMLMTRRNRNRLEERLRHHLGVLQEKHDVQYPGKDRDRLFESLYSHQHRLENDACKECLKDMGTCTKDCDKLRCEDSHLIMRQRLRDHEVTGSNGADHRPRIHFGRFGSANAVMQSGLDRDRIARDDGIVAFEMESSGVWDNFPTIVVKSACDYADSHKSKEWQMYAAATSAASLKAVLEKWEISDRSTTQS